MLNFIKKHWSIIGFVIIFLIDQETGFLNNAVESETWQNNIRFAGAILLMVFFGKDISQVKSLILKRTYDVGGTNVPPDKDEK